MKKILSLLSLATLTLGMLGSCSKINERIDGLEGRINGLENEQIASINSQIANINSSIADLGQIRSDITSLKQSAENHSQEIFDLMDADEILENRILTLQNFLDDVLPTFAETEWVEATFSTLAQYEATCDTIAKIDARIGALDAKLSKDIKACADSLTKWVNKTFEGYYTAAQMDAKLTQMKTDIDSAKAAGKITDAKADSIATELTATKTAVDTAKANIRAEYKAAVKSAIEESEGKLTKALTEAITTVNGKIESLTTRVGNLETSVNDLLGRVIALEGMIQSVTIVPAYSDGSVDATIDGILYLDIIVEPAAAVAGLTKDNFKVLVNEVKTKSVKVDTVAVEDIRVDVAKGTVTARANILSKLPESGKALTIALNVWKGKSDYTTHFYPVTLSTSNVTITDETEATKVSIKADEDFPESVMGNIGVAEGFKDTKPTSVSIPMPSLKVGGIGTVTFNETATAKIKANAEGSTNVFFKVEDVTTTKPVENADVVLEVTMKTVDENGKEVFNEKNAEGEVTIQIPMDENVAYVNSVTLVNDAGEPIEGGVVPGSEEIENGILTFKVNHFSKYAIDYVTKADFVAVTGVSIEPAEVTLGVGDTLRLAAVIVPENATNKKVTWSSSDTTKVKVDDTGKITAVAFGNATITVTTKDGNKTADCTVKVSETKTMADILKTTTGIPESQNLTPPANAWVNSTDPDCKAFIGVDAEGDKLFVILKEGSGLAPLGICMDDAFARIDDNTYQRIEPSVGTFTIQMAEGKFTSYEFEAVSGSAYEQFNGTYSASTISTIADVLATAGDNAPSAANHWNDTKGNYIYVDGGQLLVYVSLFGGSAGVAFDNTVTPNGDNYLYSEGVLSFTFNMTEGVLTSIYVDLDAYGVNDTFSPAPNSALKGVFSVGDTKKVQFSRGNLYWDGDSYEFEANQYTIGTWNAENHVNYFFWSKKESVAKAESYADASAAASDVFFTNATAETAKADFTVSGVTGKFRTLSAGEWTYILSNRANAADLLVEDVTVCDVEHCLVIAPDACLNSYVFDKTKKSYDAAAWATAEAAGLVCLPPAGYRDGTEVKSGEGNGFYWASTTDAADKASNLGFKKSDN